MKRLLVTCMLLPALLPLAPARGQESVKPGMCRPWLDSALTTVTLETAAAWADHTPLRVSCDDGKVYVLQRFDISIFTRNPLQNREFGTGEAGGIPILARKALDRCGPGDAFILKNAVCLDADGQELALPVISFEIQK